MTTENDFVEESLGQILGLFVLKTLASEVAINRFPVSLKK
jgi:hypothetical protein